MFRHGGCAYIATRGVIPCGNGSVAQFRRRGDRGHQVRGERQGLVEMDVHHLQRIIGGDRLGKIDRRGLSAGGLRRVLGEARWAELGGQRRCRPRSRPVLHRVWLRRRNPVEMGGQAGLDAHLLRGQTRSAPQEFEGVHPRGRIRQRERFGQPGRNDLFGFDAVRQLGSRDQGAFERKRSRRLRRVAGQWPRFPRIVARLSGHHPVRGILVPDVGPFLGRDLLVGMPAPKMLGQGGLATKAVHAINGTGLQQDERVDPAYAFPHSGISHMYGLLPLWMRRCRAKLDD